MTMPRFTEPCRRWSGRINGQGYGIAKYHQYAHRVSYEQNVGPIPPGLTIDHLCHTYDLSCKGGPTCPHRACVEPTHLEPVTNGTNVKRGHSYWAAKTECKYGHPYDEANTIRSTKGGRICRACDEPRRKIARRARAQAKTTCHCGRLYDRIDRRGGKRCSFCMAASGRNAMAARWPATNPHG